MHNKSKIYSLSDSDFKNLILDNKTYSDCLRQLGLCETGSASRTILKRRIQELNINIDHFNKCVNNIPNSQAKPLSAYLIKGSYVSKQNLKRRLLKEKIIPYKCSICGNNGIWNNKKLSLQLDHINGDNTDNRIENLRFICPNCHSQTDTYAGKNVVHKHNQKQQQKKCEYCQQLYVPKFKAQRFCSQECSKKSQRKTCRPSLQQLTEDIKNLNNNISAVGRKYGVSDNAIRKWIKYYNKNMGR